jgi:hypothetical protein
MMLSFLEGIMSLETVNSLAAVGTFVVIGTTAIAAVVQLRHLRASNQLQGLLTVLARVEDANFNQWVDDARRTLEKNLPDQAYRRSIEDGSFERANNSWLNLANSYEWVGSLVRQGLIAEDAFMDVYSARVIRAWRIMEGVVAIARRRSSVPWENFEYIFVRANQFENRRPNGSYPKSTPRAQFNDKWLAADAATR